MFVLVTRPIIFALHLLVLILNFTVKTNFITVPLCDCKILCFNDQCVSQYSNVSYKQYLALMGS